MTHQPSPSPDFQIIPISPKAQLIDIYTTEARNKNTICAVTQADVTEVRRLLADHKEKTGESISMTAFIITVFARAVEMHKYPVNTMRNKKKNKFYVFDEVDVMTNIEREVDGMKKPVNYTVRSAHKKTLRQIHDELTAARTSKSVELTSSGAKARKMANLLPRLPRFIQRKIIHEIFSDPLKKRKYLGTVGVTAVGMFSKEQGTKLYNYYQGGNGFMVHITPHTLSLGVGGIGWQPCARPFAQDGEIVNHEFLDLTIALDHAIIDGAPATRFLRDLILLLEKYCIEEPWCFQSLSSPPAA